MEHTNGKEYHIIYLIVELEITGGEWECSKFSLECKSQQGGRALVERATGVLFSECMDSTFTDLTRSWHEGRIQE